MASSSNLISRQDRHNDATFLTGGMLSKDTSLQHLNDILFQIGGSDTGI